MKKIELTQFMHKLIMNTPNGYDTDHIDGNKLDNRKIKLRICTHKENTRNRSINKKTSGRYKGVSYHKANKKWQANIRTETGYTYIGIYATQEEAAMAYNNFAKKNFGEFAKLNVIKERA